MDEGEERAELSEEVDGTSRVQGLISIAMKTGESRSDQAKTGKQGRMTRWLDLEMSKLTFRDIEL